MKISGKGQSRRSPSSTGYQSPAPTYEREKAKDNRKTIAYNNNEAKTPVICPTCGGSIFLKQYKMIGNHRVGGGRYSIKRGDALCLSSNTSMKE